MTRFQPSRTRLAVLAAATGLAALTVAPATAAAGHPAPGRTTTQATQICGTLTGSPLAITKVVWIFMENTSYGSASNQIPGSPSATYIDNTLLAQCGSTSDYHAVAHPSYPNYLAATTGSTQGATSDKLHYYNNAPSIFSQVNPSWRSYEEFMPKACDHVGQAGSASAGFYVGRHNPAASMSAAPIGAPGADCTTYDTALGTTNSGALVQAVNTGTLPKFSFVTPGLCDDMHTFPKGVAGCSNPIGTGDSWLARWIPILTSGPDYTNGNLLIDVAWDEGRGGKAGTSCVGSSLTSCIVPNIVISPYTPHYISPDYYDHYSLLRTTEEILRVGTLGNASTASDMCAAFHIC